MIKSILVTFLAILLGSCAIMGKKSLSDESYKKWLSDNVDAITDTMTVNDVYFSLRIYPYDLDLLRISDAEERKEAARELHTETGSKKLMRFALKTELPASADIYSYKAQNDIPGTDRARYYAFEAHRDFALITKSNDTLKSVKVITERPISGYPVSLFLVEFEGANYDEVKQLIFRDRFLSGSMLVFDILKFSTVELPELTTND